MSLLGALAEVTRNGWAVDFGSVALDAANPTSVTTKVTIQGAMVVMNTKTAPGLNTSVVTWFVETATAQQLDIYGWKPTGAAATTLIASDGTETVEWMAWGPAV